MSLKRLSTGVPGINEVLGGGVPSTLTQRRRKSRCPPRFAETSRESLYRMVGHLSGAGVSVMLSVEIVESDRARLRA